jgi:hypothetical protein
MPRSTSGALIEAAEEHLGWSIDVCEARRHVSSQIDVSRHVANNSPSCTTARQAAVVVLPKSPLQFIVDFLSNYEKPSSVTVPHPKSLGRHLSLRPYIAELRCPDV